jgi:hypothetical protein
MSIKLYPLVFEPILQDRIWGGTKLKTDLGKKYPYPNYRRELGTFYRTGQR